MIAAENNISSVSFPSISTGAYGYPIDEAARVALETVASSLREQASSVKEVVFVLFDSLTFGKYTSALKAIIKR